MMLPPDSTLPYAGGSLAAPKRERAHERSQRDVYTTSTRPVRAFSVPAAGSTGGSSGQPPPDSKDRPSSLEYAALDGVTHINIYNRSKCELGHRLSHFYKSPFRHPFYGPFNSMEGFWYWIKAAKPDDMLRQLDGFQAKQHGKSLRQGPRYDSFYDVIVEANFYKIVQNPTLRKMVTDSVLPFDHYFLWGPGPMFVRPVNFEWLVQGFEAIRRELKQAEREGIEPVWVSPTYEAHLG